MDVRVLSVAFMVCVAPPGITGAYYGKLIGAITTLEHSFSGTVYAASESSIFFTDLVYDGRGPAAHFWGGKSVDKLDIHGELLPDETGSTNVVKPYNKAKVLLRLPKKITEYRSIGMYCKAYDSDFGHVNIAPDYVLPAEQSLGKLNGNQSGSMATEVVLRDSAIMLLKGFQHDAQCPSATFVAAPGAQPKPEELTHLAYDGQEKGTLGRFNSTDVTVQLSEGHHWNEFNWFSVYCIDTKRSYADVLIDKKLAESLPLHVPESTPATKAIVTQAPPISAKTPAAANSGMLIRPLPLLTAVGMAAVAAAVAVRLRQGDVQRTKCS